MKAQPSKKQKKTTTARKSAGKVKMSATASGLTSQAGLIPVVKFLDRIGFEQTVNQTVPHQRGDNAEYQLTGSMLLVLVGMIGGASSIAKLCAVWSDGVLREVAGWLKIPVESKRPARPSIPSFSPVIQHLPMQQETATIQQYDSSAKPAVFLKYLLARPQGLIH